MKRWISALLPVLLYAALIVYLSSRSELPHAPRIWDKAAHFIEYAVLGLLLARGLYLVTRWDVVRSGLVAMAVGTFFGFTDELHQFFVPGRDASLGDLVADFLGSVAGASTYVAFIRLRERWRGPVRAGSAAGREA